MQPKETIYNERASSHVPDSAVDEEQPFQGGLGFSRAYRGIISSITPHGSMQLQLQRRSKQIHMNRSCEIPQYIKSYY